MNALQITKLRNYWVVETNGGTEAFVSRHTVPTASDPPFEPHEQHINILCEAYLAERAHLEEVVAFFKPEYSQANSGGAWSEWRVWTPASGIKLGDLSGGYRKWKWQIT